MKNLDKNIDKSKIMNSAKGRIAEISAQKFLTKIKKYKILETNYKNKIGEIDIICKYKDFLIFVEVKSKQENMFCLPREMVTPIKIKKIKNVATMYLLSHKLNDLIIRFDVIEIIGNKITHIENAF